MERTESSEVNGEQLKGGKVKGEKKVWQTLAAPVGGMVLGMVAVIAGIGGTAAGISPESLPNLFIGVTGAGMLFFLLMIPIFNKRKAKGKKKRNKTVQPVDERKVWAMTAEQVCTDLNVSDRQGLSPAEAEDRHSKFGANETVIRRDPGYWSFFVKEIYEPTQLLLLCVGILYLMFGSLEESITAFMVIILMASAEVGTEWRAKRALNNLQHSSPQGATVKRDGQYETLEARWLVPGDIVILRVGMEVPADLRLIRSCFLYLDESKLTGESTPVPKEPSQVLPEETSLLDRTNVALAGSLVTRGRGVGVVYQIGTATYLGQVLALSHKKKDKKTKLQSVMKELASRLTILALIMSVTGALLGLWKGTRWQDVVLTGLSLAFATIPEELPILIAAVLAVGAQALSKRFMYVKKLRAAENLGFIDTILTDKTGTLTENWLLWHSAHLGTENYEIRSRLLPFRRNLDHAGMERVLEAWLFMSDIGDDLEDFTLPPAQEQVPNDGDVTVGVNHSSKVKDSDDEAGDPPTHNVDADKFDRAVLFALGSRVTFLGGPSGHGFLASNPNIKLYLESVYKTKMVSKFVDEAPFDPTFKFSSRTFQINADLLKSLNIEDSPAPNSEVQVMYIKGAPELLLKHCSYAMENGSAVPIDAVQGQIEEQVAKAASQGHRLIGYAYKWEYFNSISGKPVGNPRGGSQPLSVLQGGTFLGFFSFLDTVREEAAGSVLECQEAGVRVIMVTGDHPSTAIAVAQQVGIVSSKQDSDPSDMAVSCTDIQFSNMRKEEQLDIVMNKRVFARATPADKLVLLEALQSLGKCVMATGDGVNDSPILARADVGVAMGKGTDVAREAAAIVIMDDNFNMIPFSLAEGRRLLDNLRKALAFYLGAKTGLIFLFILGTLLNRDPLSAIQIILLELFMDLGASSSFLMEPADNDIMKRMPRHSGQRFFDSELLTGISISAATLCASVLLSFMFAAHEDPQTAQASAFFTWLFVQVFVAINLRTFRQPVSFKGLFSNVGMLIWLLVTIVLSVVISLSPFLQSNLGLVSLSGKQWLFIIFISIVGTSWIEIAKLVSVVFQTRKAASQPDWVSIGNNGIHLSRTVDESLPLMQTGGDIV